jgi:hypothetical protein
MLAWVCAGISPCWICGGQSGNETAFSLNLYIPTALSNTVLPHMMTKSYENSENVSIWQYLSL